MIIDKTLTKKLVAQAQSEISSFGGTVPTQLSLSEQEDGYLLCIHAPSVEAESYKVEVKKGHLIITSFIYFDHNKVPRFVQAFPILPHVDSYGIEATYVDGELRIFAPFKGDNNLNFDADTDLDL